ncbi:MAG: hypothetical protein A4E57_04515 [Syntrophorhabdaceae bacterium PtaU1.Bin034]|nr:MAG: hypothetical protein A4E57_04515 [Syntrophorhabdaceae bacterium PtaU1.Bin034]
MGKLHLCLEKVQWRNSACFQEKFDILFVTLELSHRRFIGNNEFLKLQDLMVDAGEVVDEVLPGCRIIVLSQCLFCLGDADVRHDTPSPVKREPERGAAVVYGPFEVGQFHGSEWRLNDDGRERRRIAIPRSARCDVYLWHSLRPGRGDAVLLRLDVFCRYAKGWVMFQPIPDDRLEIECFGGTGERCTEKESYMNDRQQGEAGVSPHSFPPLFPAAIARMAARENSEIWRAMESISCISKISLPKSLLVTCLDI